MEEQEDSKIHSEVEDVDEIKTIGDEDAQSVEEKSEITTPKELTPPPKKQDKGLVNTERILQRNKMMNQLLEEVKVSESQKLEMQKQIQILSMKLEESTTLIDRANLEYSQLTKSLKDSELIIDNLQQERDSLLVRVEDFARKNQQRITNEDEIIAAVNQRVEEWKAVFLTKETQILHLQNEIVKLKESLALSSATKNKTTVEVLSKAVRDKDTEINRLKGELQQATKELEESAVVIENLNSAQNQPKDSDWHKKQISNLRKKLSTVELRESELKLKASEAEESVGRTEKALAEALARLNAYESKEYGLSDAVQEIKSYRYQLEIRDRQIEELTLVVSQMEISLMDLKDENDELKNKLGLEVEKETIEDILHKLQSKNSEYTKKKLQKNLGIKRDESIVTKTAEPLFDTQTPIIMKEMTKQIQLLHSEFEELIKSTKKLKGSAVNNQNVESITRQTDDEFSKKYSPNDLEIVNTQDLLENIEKLKRKLKNYEDESADNALNIAKLEKDLADANETIEKLESKLMNEFPEKPSQILDTQLALQLKELACDNVDRYAVENKKNVKQEMEKLKQVNETNVFNQLEFDTLNQQYQNLIETLKKTDDEIKSELAEMSRKLTISNVNERKLFRKCSYLMDQLNFEKLENSKLQNEMLTISSASICHLGFLESFKQLACYKIAALHRALEGTVLTSDLKVVEQQLAESIDKQHLLIQQNNQLLSLKTTSTTSDFENVMMMNNYVEESSVKELKGENKELRSELEDCKTENILLLNEISRLKVINEVAENQVKSMQVLNTSKSLELESLKTQTLETYCEGQEKELIKKLYMQILHLQMSESNLQNKLEKCQTQIQKIEMISVRLEQKCDEKDEKFYRHCWGTHIKLNRLRKIIRQLLWEQNEKKGEISLAFINIKENQLKIDDMLKNVREEEQKVNLMKVEFETKNNSLSEQMALITDNNLNESLEKYYKIANLRIQNNKQSCQLGWLTKELEQSEAISKRHVNRIAHLEDQLTKLKNEFWEREIALEKRDFELEKNAQFSDDPTAFIIPKPKKDATVGDERLQNALRELKENSNNLSEKEIEIKELKKKEKDNMRRVEELEILLSARDQVIEELKSNRNEFVESPTNVEENPSSMAYAVIEGLKARVSQKEETIAKYQEMMENVKKEMMQMVENHQKEMENKNVSTQPLQNLEKFDETFIIKNQNISAKQISKMNELQEITIQQDNAIIILADKLKASSKEIQKWQLKVENMEKEVFQEKEKIIEEYELSIKKLNDETEQIVFINKKLKDEMELVKEKLEEQIIANKSSPTTMMKTAIEDLKSQLKIKDREAQSLSRVVANLNGKMKMMVEENLSKQTQVSEQKCQHCQSQDKQLEISKAEMASLRRKLKTQETAIQNLKEIETKLNGQSSLCIKLKSENQKLQQTIQNLELKLRKITETPKVHQEDLRKFQQSNSEVVEKLKQELVQLSKQNSRLQTQIEKTKNENKKVSGSKQTADVGTKSQDLPPSKDINKKIQMLMDEVDRLTEVVKMATAASSQQANESLVEEFQSLLGDEGKLRTEIINLHQENVALKNKMERMKNESSSDLLKLLKEKVDGNSVRLPDAVTSKIVEHNERLLKDYQKEVKTNEKQRIQLHVLKIENEKLNKQLEAYYKIVQKKQIR